MSVFCLIDDKHVPLYRALYAGQAIASLTDLRHLPILHLTERRNDLRQEGPGRQHIRERADHAPRIQ